MIYGLNNARESKFTFMSSPTLRYARKQEWKGEYLDTDHRDEGIQFKYSVYDNSTEELIYLYDNAGDIVLRKGITITENGINIENSGFDVDEELHIEPSGSLDATNIIEFINQGTKQERYLSFRGGKLYSTNGNYLDEAHTDDVLLGDSTKPLPSKEVSDRRLVIFLGNQGIDELVLHGGYITTNSIYTAPFMYDTGRGYWINYGPIYGYVEITDVKGNLFMRFTRHYNSGKLSERLIRTTFIPTREDAGGMEWHTIIDNEKFYTRWYNNQGVLITEAEYIAQHRTIKSILSDFIITDLANLVMDFL